jgi:hypothetical protein
VGVARGMGARVVGLSAEMCICFVECHIAPWLHRLRPGARRSAVVISVRAIRLARRDSMPVCSVRFAISSGLSPRPRPSVSIRAISLSHCAEVLHFLKVRARTRISLRRYGSLRGLSIRFPVRQRTRLTAGQVGKLCPCRADTPG